MASAADDYRRLTQQRLDPSHDHQRERILTFLDTTRDPLGAGYHSTQASSTLFGRLLSGAVTLMFFTYAFVNMAMVSGVLMSVQSHRKLVNT